MRTGRTFGWWRHTVAQQSRTSTGTALFLSFPFIFFFLYFARDYQTSHGRKRKRKKKAKNVWTRFVNSFSRNASYFLFWLEVRYQLVAGPHIYRIAVDVQRRVPFLFCFLNCLAFANLLTHQQQFQKGTKNSDSTRFNGPQTNNDPSYSSSENQNQIQNKRAETPPMN